MPFQQQKLKLTGDRSLQSKLHRLACEFEHDANRVKRDHPGKESLSESLRSIASRLGDLSRSMEES